MKLKPVPKRIRTSLDSHPEINEKINNFFSETKKYLELHYGKSPNIEIKSNNFAETEGNLTYLLYKDQVVAGVFETRTEFNNLEYIFFRDIRGLESHTNS